VLLAHRKPNVREGVSLVTAGVLVVLVVALFRRFASGDIAELALLEMLPGLTISFTVEPFGLGFALIASLLWLVTVLYAIGYMRAHGEGHQTRFYAFFALAIAATIGGAFAGNLLTLYIF